MAQIAQKRLYFKIGELPHDFENDTSDKYLDIAAALTAVNRKQYHQFNRKGDPLCYTVTVTSIVASKPLVICTAPNTWTTRNAAKKTAEGWEEQLNNSQIRISQLPTYAQRFRCAFDKGAVDTGINAQHLAYHLTPDGCDGTVLFTPYISTDGGTVTYANSNDVVLLPISEDDPDEAYKACLLGDTDAAGMSFGMIYEFLKSRRNMREETDMGDEFPDADGLMNTLFATAETLADDVTAAVDDYSITRPYSIVNANESVLAANVSPGTTNYRETFSAPLGLLHISGDGLAANDEFIIDIEAVYEM